MSNDLDLSFMEPILKKYQSQEGALITILQEIQEVYGYLPEVVLTHLSRKIKIPLSQIYGVVTFYAQFHLTRRGRNIIRFCRGTTCYIRGCSSILSALMEELGVKEGGTTEDLQFSLEVVACLGTCFSAPVMMINNTYYGRLDIRKARTIVESYRRRNHPGSD